MIADRVRRPADDARRVEARGAAVPGGAADDVLAPRREPRVPDGPAAEGELPERGERLAAREEPRAGPGQDERERGRGGRDDGPPGGRSRKGGRGRGGPATGREGREVAQVAGEVARGGVAPFPLLREAARQDPAHGPVDRFRQPGNRLGLVPDDGGERVDEGAAGEGPPPRQELVEDGPEGELVGPVVDVASLGLLRGHVRGRPDGDSRDRRRGAGNRCVVRRGDGRGREEREAEVEDLRVPLARDEDVRGLHVAVDEPRLVRGREAGGDLRREVERARDGERARREEVGERPPRDELEDEERRVRVERDVVDGDDVRVGEGRGRPRLPRELAERVRRGAGAEEELDRDAPPEPRVVRSPDLAPRPVPEELHGLVGAEAHPRVNAARLGGHGPPPSRSPSWFRSRWR